MTVSDDIPKSSSPSPTAADEILPAVRAAAEAFADQWRRPSFSASELLGEIADSLDRAGPAVARAANEEISV